MSNTPHQQPQQQRLQQQQQPAQQQQVHQKLVQQQQAVQQKPVQQQQPQQKPLQQQQQLQQKPVVAPTVDTTPKPIEQPNNNVAVEEIPENTNPFGAEANLDDTPIECDDQDQDQKNEKRWQKIGAFKKKPSGNLTLHSINFIT